MEPVKCALDAVYNWNYKGEIDQLRNLYVKALDNQWIAMKQLQWQQDVDPLALIGGGEDPDPLIFPFVSLSLWQELDRETKRNLQTKLVAFLLSQFLHGEQGGLMVAGQLVSAVPDMAAKFYAASQTLDEARHVEVFSTYISKVEKVYPIEPALKGLLDRILETDDWPKKAVGMQIVAEGLALASFRNLRRASSEPLLRELLKLVCQDEARHTAYGILYLSEEIPRLPESQRVELEDFAFEATRSLIDMRTGGGFGMKLLTILTECGVDPARAINAVLSERDKLVAADRAARRNAGFDPDPIRGFVLPHLERLGLMTDRTRAGYEDVLRANMLSGFEDSPLDGSLPVPDDIEAWMNKTI